MSHQITDIDEVASAIAEKDWEMIAMDVAHTFESEQEIKDAIKRYLMKADVDYYTQLTARDCDYERGWLLHELLFYGERFERVFGGDPVPEAFFEGMFKTIDLDMKDKYPDITEVCGKLNEAIKIEDMTARKLEVARLAAVEGCWKPLWSSFLTELYPVIADAGPQHQYILEEFAKEVRIFRFDPAEMILRKYHFKGLNDMQVKTMVTAFCAVNDPVDYMRQLKYGCEDNDWDEEKEELIYRHDTKNDLYYWRDGLITYEFLHQVIPVRIVEKWSPEQKEEVKQYFIENGFISKEEAEV